MQTADSKNEELETFLRECGAATGCDVLSQRGLKQSATLPFVHVGLHKDTMEDASTSKKTSSTDDNLPSKVFFELEKGLEKFLKGVQESPVMDNICMDKAASIGLQIGEMRLLQLAGSRILCLDGGGMKGLMEIDILEQIEKKTGRKITELFDWFVGTSTGAVIALCLVYGT